MSDGKIDAFEVQAAIQKAWEEGKVEAPWGTFMVDTSGLPLDADGNAYVASEVWASYPWNPLKGRESQGLDANASPKPTWADIVLWWRLWRLGREELNDPDDHLRYARDRVLSAAVQADADLSAGGGLAHMPALIQIANDTLAGSYPERMTLLEAGQAATRDFHLHGDMSAVIERMSKRTNRVESERNLIRAEAEVLRTAVLDANGGLDATATDAAILAAREAAHAKLNALLADDALQSRLAEAAAKPRTALPGDLPTARAVLRERLEAAATGRQKHLKGALSQQAIDNWAACVDMDRALQEVSKECVLASIEIDRADTMAAAKAAYEAGVGAIRAVTAANTPHWNVNGAQIAQANPPPQTVKGSVAVIRAAQPAGTTIEGKVSMGLGVTAGTGVKWAVQSVGKDPSARQFRVTIADDVTEDATLEVVARNLCGPSQLTVVMKPGANQ